jgi:hypothetical protein
MKGEETMQGEDKRLVDEAVQTSAEEVKQPVPVPQAAWAMLEALERDVALSRQRLQLFVDGLALGQGVVQGAQLVPLEGGGWGWLAREHARTD